jgi:uncharacterized repeat protein (TIGR02543 family)
MKRLSSFYIYPFIALLFFLIFLLPTSVGADATTFSSDDFNSFNLNTVLWQFIDPVGNATLTMTGTHTQDAWVSISVPAGTSHNVWDTGNDAPRIMQSASDTDFEIEVKFESGVSQQYQMQGVLVEEDSEDFLRFDFNSDGTKTKVFVASFTDGTPLQRVDKVIADTNVAPLYMRVKREGDLWTQSYHYDGVGWTPSISFTHPLTVAAVGAFVGNAGTNPPAHTGSIDYFFNTASPISPEDEIPGDPLFLSDIQVTPGDAGATVTWGTNEPATSSVAYGQSSAYGSSVDDSTLVTEHTIPLTSLISGTLYHYEVTSVDGSDNMAISPDLTFTTKSLPTIDIWYGSNQAFGHIGRPQRWVNILGNASDPDDILSLTYSLNGGPELPLSIGADGYRLADEGDFNVEIDHADLLPGTNEVVITATDIFDDETVEHVNVEYTSGNTWPETYSIDWSAVTDIQDVAQVVDGLWTVEGDHIRPVGADEDSYDRLVAIGDVSWLDYEVTVPITIHTFFDSFEKADPGVGILVRWNGHGDDSLQPHREHPFGGLGWFRKPPEHDYYRLSILGNDNFDIATDEGSHQLVEEVPYIFKIRVETLPGGSFYSFKVWEASDPEPSAWDLSGYGSDADPDEAHGSVLLVAHRTDASFGDVTITPGPFDDTPPVISDVQVMPSETTAMITWTTDEPATSGVDYGESPSYGNSVDDSALVTEHAITLTGLISGTLYHYQITSVDGNENATHSTDLTFRTASTPSSIVSDDFNTCGLNTGLWMWTDPLDDATLAMTGTHTYDAWVSIAVPAGISHDIWDEGNQAPRIMQPANDTDFEIEVKFESGVSQQYQIQGVLVEEDDDDFLRLDFHSWVSDTRLFAAIFEPGSPLSPTIKYNERITDTNVAPLYMRVKREGDQWEQYYSYDGVSWTPSISFTHSLTVTAVGAFVGNDGGSSPAHTGHIDYFFNTASPIVPEDGDRNTLAVNWVGSGSVITEPAKSTYSCGEVVTLTATADLDWSFAGWSGDLFGMTNPLTVTMTGSKVITATFTQDEYDVTVTIVGQGSVTNTPGNPYHYDDIATLEPIADAGWTFAGWSGPDAGELSDEGDGTWSIIMDGNKSVTATFTGDEDNYQVFLPLITVQYSP